MKKTIKLFGMLLAFVAVITLAACDVPGRVTPDAVDATSIRYDGSKFTWGAAKNADSYKIVVAIDGTDGSEVTVATPAYGKTASEKNSSMSITITSVNTGSGKSSDAVSATFTKLDTITDVTFDQDGVMSWTDIENANAYLVNIDGKDYETVDTTYSDFPVGKQISIKVKPIATDGSTYSFYSKAVTKMYLAAPSNIKFDGATISWTGNSYASSYELYIDGSLRQNGLKVSSYAYDAHGDSFEVSLKSIGDGQSTFSSKESEAVRYTYLDTIDSVTVDNGKIVWKAVEGADSYKVKLGNGTVTTVNKPEYAVSAGVSVSIQVQPVASQGNFFSSYSETKTVFIHQTPTVTWLSGVNLSDGEKRTCINWNGSTGAVSGYTVRVTYLADGVADSLKESNDYEENIDHNYFEYGFNKVGTYTLQVRVNADSSSGVYYDSAFCNEITVVRIPGPQKTTTPVTSTANNFYAGFDIHYLTDSRAEAYKLIAEGTEVNGRTSTTNYLHVPTADWENYKEGAELTFQVQAIGKGKTTVNNMTYVYLDSLTADNLSVPITILAVPKNISFDGPLAQWDTVPGASYYCLQLNGQVEVDFPKYDFETSMQPGEAKFMVWTKGDGEAKLASPHSEEYTVVRLQNPTDLKISTSLDENKLSWTEVNHARSYQAFFNSESTPVAISKNDSIYQYIRTTGLTVDLIAVANYADSENNRKYYVSSPKMSQPKTFYKLQAPTFGSVLVSGGYLQWNPSGNADQAQYTPDYRIWNYNYGKVAVTGMYKASQWSIDGQGGAIAGQKNRFAVQALGDGNTWINSDISEIIEFTYLDTPKVQRIGNNFTWESVMSAKSYDVFIEGALVKTIAQTSDTINYPVDLQYFPSTNKTYEIIVIARGDNGVTIVDSGVKKEENLYLQETKMATEPTFKFEYLGNVLTIDGVDYKQYKKDAALKLTITDQCDHTYGYKYSVGGSESAETQELSYQYVPNATGPLELYAWGTGGVFDDQGILYLASEHAHLTVTLLDGVSSLKNDSSGFWDWTQTQNQCTGFYYQIIYKDETSNSGTVRNARLEYKGSNSKLASGKTVEDVEKVIIIALGDKNTTVASASATIYYPSGATEYNK